MTIKTWQVGEVKISRIIETELAVAYYEKYPFMRAATPQALQQIPWLYPDFVSAEDELKISIHALLVEAPGLRLLVDTCIGNDKPRAIIRHESLATDFLQDLQAAGCPRESIDVVVCTHLHVDHVGWNTMKLGDKWLPTFPNARYLLGKQEYEFWSNSESEEQIPVMQDSVTPIFEAGLVDLVATDHQISDQVRLFPTLGHTPGHVSVMIESAGEVAVITGDSMHHPCQIARPDWTVSFDEDRAQAVSSREKLLHAVSDSQVLLIGTHFAGPTAGRVVRDGDGYRLITDV